MASRSLGTLTIDLIAKVGGFEQGMDKAARSADKRLKEIEDRAYKFGQALGSAFKIGAGLAVAGIGALGVALQQTINGLDELSKSAQKVGITTEELSKLAYAGELADVSLDSLVGSLGRLTKAQAEALDEGSKTADVFEALGIAVKGADGNLRSSTQVLGDFAERFQELGGSPEAVAAGFQLFGRSFQDLIPLLKDGRAGIEAAGDELERMGGVIRDDTGRAAEEFNDNLTRLKAQFQSVFAQIAQQLLPVLVDLSEDLKGLASNGDLARNAVTLLNAILDAGVGAMKLYNAAVDNVSVAIDQAVKSYDGWVETTRNAATFGLAEGSVVDGINKIRDAANEAAEARERLAARRNAPATVSPESEGIDFTRGAPLSAEEQAKANRQLQVALAGVDEQKKRNARSTRELTEEEKRFREEILEVNELIDETARDRQEEIRQDRQQRADDFDALLGDLEHERELIGKTAEEQERLNLLRYAGSQITDEQARQLEESLAGLQTQREAVEDQTNAMDGLRDSFSGFLSDLKEGKGFADSLSSALDNVLDTVFQIVAQNLAESLFGQKGSTAGGSSGGWISQLAGAFFGGGRAGGGPVRPGTLYEVNERGAEMLSVGNRDYLMMGSQAGTVTPSERIGFGGGMSVVQHIYNPNYVDPRSRSQVLQQESEQLRISARNS